ncbi:MAG TPA: TonB-dependent receptor [Terracidiphilus sp.]|nr:TonB-dependent receptor [Terracidiphilus sp.]
MKMLRNHCPQKCLAVLALAAFLATFSGVSALAQTSGAGTINGTVTDAAQAAIPGASVIVTNTDTGIAHSYATNSSGFYIAPFLMPGHYSVLGAAGGFGTVKRENLTLNVGQTMTLDMALSPASVTTQVTVTGENPILDTQKTEASQVIDSHIISNLPVNGRRWDNFVLLTPNVAPDGSTGLIAYRGVSGIYNSNEVDGANNNQAFFSEARGRSIGAPYVYSQDSIQEFQSEAAAYSAEFGQAAGGQVNAITRSGASQLHGDLFYYLRYPALNALDPIGKNSGIHTQAVHQQQQFGGSVGGPFVHDKLFYFLTYDGFRKVNPILYTSSVSAATLQTYASATNCPAGVTVNQCQTAVNYLLSLQGAFPRNIKQDIFFPKIDYQLNEKNHISTSFNWQNFNEPNGYNTSISSNNGSVTQNGTANFHERFFLLNWTTTLRPNLVNEARFQWARDLETDTTNSPGPSINITGLSAYGETSALPRGAFPDEHRLEFGDIVSVNFGRHALRTGTDLNFIHELLINLFQGDGGYTYRGSSTLVAFQNWVQDVYQLNGGQHYALFTQVNDPITGLGKDDFWNPDLSGFVQDSWRVKPNLLLTAGLRYDAQLIPQPPKPNTTSTLASLYTSTINIDKHEFQPRLGFSWQPFPTTVVHGGYGIFYGLSSNSTYYTTRVENGVYQQQYNAVPGVQSWAPVAPNVLFTPPGPALAAPFSGAVTPKVVNTGAALIPLAFRGLDPHFLNPYSHSTDLTVEQQFPLGFTVSVGWVANRALRLPIFIDTNVAPATATKTYAIISSTGSQTGAVTLPFYNARVAAADASVLTGFSDVNSWYNSMVATVKKPFAHGIELIANYTWAHATDGGQVSGVNGTFNGTDTPLDPFSRKAEYGRSDLDMRERFVGTLVFSPQLSFIQVRPIRLLANGWLFSGTATEQTGFPITANMASYPTSPIADGGLTGAEVSLFNGGTGGRAPQVRRNAFPGPGLRDIDFRISRRFTVYKEMNLEVFGEAFNLLNQRNFFSVNTSAFSWVASGATIAGGGKCPQGDGCIQPYTSQAFGAPTSSSSLLYGPRQLQVSAKLTF